MPIVKLNQDYVSNHLYCPEGRDKVELIDDQVQNFFIEVRASNPNAGVFRVRYRDNGGKGTTRYVTVGKTTELTLAEARGKAKEIKASIALGADPRGEANAQRKMITVAELFEKFVLPHSKAHKRSYARDLEMFNLRIKPSLGHLRLTDVTRRAVQVFHAGLVDEGLKPATADLYAKCIRWAMALAVEWEFIEANPLAKFKLFHPDNRKENYLDEKQLEQLMAVLHTDPNRTVCLIATYLLACGCRLSEGLSAAWDQIDKTHRVWRIPASNSKSKKVRSVPLNDSAMDVLEQLDTEGEFDHLFVNRRTGKPYTTIMKVWERLRQKAGLPDLRLHDLRHSYASFLVNSGTSLYIVQTLLGHSSPKVTERYSHLSSKTLQEAANAASVAIKGATKAA
jgi:integrase